MTEMSGALPYFDHVRLVEKKLDYCEDGTEAWKAHHEQAMQVIDIEVLVGDVNELYEDISRLVEDFVETTANGRIPYDFDREEKIMDLCERWIRLSVALRDGDCNWAVSEGYEVTTLAKLDENIEKAKGDSPLNYDAYVMGKASKIHISKERVDALAPHCGPFPDDSCSW